MKYATSLAAVLLAWAAEYAQQQQQQAGPKRDDLDVTMQIIVDPDAKLPDEVVRRIPLPERKPADHPRPPAGRVQVHQPRAPPPKQRTGARS